MPDREPQLKPKTVFLDRDGVLNRKRPEGFYVTEWSEFEPLPGVVESIARLNHAGIRVVVVTNQRGVALGKYTCADVESIHARFQNLLHEAGAHVDAFFYCPHDKRSCECRKPLPGMYDQARQRFPEIEAKSSVMIGDSLGDIEFGRNLGMRTFFIDGDKERMKPGWERAAQLANSCYATLTEAVAALLNEVPQTLS